jgi:acyl-CoA synthetase (AMP-forming)/AMP-acid ligase II
MGFLDRLQELVRQRPAHPAICDARGEFSYAALLSRVEDGCRRLRRRGIGPETVVGVALDDETEHLVATLALLAAGARQIVLATHDSALVHQQLAARVGITHVLVRQGAAALPGIARVNWPCADAVAETGRSAPPTALAAGTLMLKTSGTTGSMNLVAFDEAQIAAQAARHADYRDERLLRLASIEHNNSKRHRLYCAWAGGTNVFRPPNAEVVDFALDHRVTCLDVSRMHAADLAASSEAHRLGTVKLRTGGSAVPTSVRQAILERTTRQLYVRYAATECGAIAMAMPGDHDAYESVGRPLPGVELQVVGADGHVLLPGETGEIRLRASGMATGYVDNPSQTAQRFRDGWFYPGDVGALRGDGQLIVQGRRDDMIVLNGLNIFPAEIERVLERHPSVAEAAALPLPSTVHGQIPVAAVVLRAGESVTAAELRRFCHQHLGLRTPRRVLVLDQLPKNSQGKTMKRDLANAFQPKAAMS